jgi:hypothetical protein
VALQASQKELFTHTRAFWHRYVSRNPLFVCVCVHLRFLVYDFWYHAFASGDIVRRYLWVAYVLTITIFSFAVRFKCWQMHGNTLQAITFCTVYLYIISSAIIEVFGHPLFIAIEKSLFTRLIFIFYNERLVLHQSLTFSNMCMASSMLCLLLSMLVLL